MSTVAAQAAGERQQQQQPQIQPCRYKVGKVLGAGSYSVVKECIHIDTGRYYAAKVINKRLMAGREHMVCVISLFFSFFLLLALFCFFSLVLLKGAGLASFVVR